MLIKALMNVFAREITLLEVPAQLFHHHKNVRSTLKFVLAIAHVQQKVLKDPFASLANKAKYFTLWDL